MKTTHTPYRNKLETRPTLLVKGCSLCVVCCHNAMDNFRLPRLLMNGSSTDIELRLPEGYISRFLELTKGWKSLRLLRRQQQKAVRVVFTLNPIFLPNLTGPVVRRNISYAKGPQLGTEFTVSYIIYIYIVPTRVYEYFLDIIRILPCETHVSGGATPLTHSLERLICRMPVIFKPNRTLLDAGEQFQPGYMGRLVSRRK